MVEAKEAAWVVVSRTRGKSIKTCGLCGGDTEVKNCAQCAGEGKIEIPAIWETFNDDVCSGMAKRTPRVATVEAKHIERAYVEGKQYARDRIEEYGETIQRFRREELGIKPEFPVRREDGGQDEDWGRAPWARRGE